ncbi:hypothetical protein HDU91_004323 [Kappamyces sp. JEL0680]|nr:hypothetical protein HDU91_004323 [Kappamyces sp. JEL0680]
MPVVSESAPSVPAKDETLQTVSTLFATVPAVVGNVPVKSYVLNYEIHGTGSRKVVLVMGLMSSMSGWGTVIDWFLNSSQSSRRDYSFLIFDNRGIGKSTPGRFERYTSKGMAQDAHKVIEHAGWAASDRQCHLVGISMGGFIALELAYLQPTLFKSLSLLVTAPVFRTPPKYPYKLERSLLSRALKRTNDSVVDIFIDACFSDEEWLGDVPAEDSETPSSQPAALPDPDAELSLVSETNRSRLKAGIEGLMATSPTPSLKTFFGQGAALRTHKMMPNRLWFIGKSIPDCLCVGAAEDKLMDPESTRELAEHLLGSKDKATIFAAKGHGIILEARQETCLELEQIFDAGEKRWEFMK